MPLIGSLSGSLTKLADGTSYIMAGAGTTVVTASDGGIIVSAAPEWSDAGSILFPSDGASESVGLGNNSNTAGDYDIYLSGDGAAVFNEQGASVDFRVESDNKSHAIFVDGSTDQVLILSGGHAISPHAGNFADTNFFVSGTMGAKNSSTKGTSTFGGDVCISGTVYTPGVTVGDSSMNFPVTTALNVYGNVESDYIVKFDNDQNTAGHVLKLSTDGTGNSTYVLQMENSSDTLFRARGDGRFGFGPSGVSSMGAGTFVVGIDGGHTADIAISKRLQHLGDADTYMDFTTTDQIEFVAGGVDMIHITEDDSQDMIVFNEGGADVDFRIESNNKTHALFIDGSTDQVLILSGGANAAGSDTGFFVSGAIWDETWGDHSAVSTFNGDVMMSGCLRIQSTGDDHEFAFGGVPGAIGEDVRFFVSGTVNSWVGATGPASPRVVNFGSDINMSGAICGYASYYGGSPNTLRLVGGGGTGEIQTIGSSIRMEPFAATTGPRGDDIFLSVSGAINSKMTGNTGTTAFGGDLCVSGVLYGSNNGAMVGKNDVTHNADSGLTQHTRSGHIDLTTNGELASNNYGSEFTITSMYINEKDVIMCTTDTQGLYAQASDIANGSFKVKLFNWSGGAVSDNASVVLNWVAL